MPDATPATSAASARTHRQRLASLRRGRGLRVVMWIAGVVLACWFFFYVSSDRPVRGIVHVDEYADEIPVAFGALDDRRDWFLSVREDEAGNSTGPLRIDNRLATELPLSCPAEIPLLAAQIHEAFAVDEDEVFVTLRGNGVMFRSDGARRRVLLLRVPRQEAAGLTVSDASVQGRRLSVLIQGRLGGRQRGSLVTYELPEVDYTIESDEPVLVLPTTDVRLDTPFVAGAFSPSGDEWAAVTRDGVAESASRLVEFSWGRTIRAPENTHDIWFLDDHTLVAQTQTDDAIEFHTALLDVEPVQFSEARLSLPAKRIWGLHVKRSLDAKHVIVLVNYFHDKKFFGYYRSHASSELSLLSLDNWTVVATATESAADWRSTVMQPYVDAAFSHDNQHVRLLRSSQQLETVHIGEWIEQSGW